MRTISIKLIWPALLLTAQLFCQNPPAEVRRIPAAELQERVRTHLLSLYAGRPERIEIEGLSRLQDWTPGWDIDSIAVRYNRQRLPRGNTVVSILAYRRKTVIRQLNCALLVRVFRRAATLAGTVRRDQPVDSSQLKWTEVEITRLHGEAVTDGAQLAGRLAARTLSAGDVLLEEYLKPVPLIRRGEAVRLRYDHQAVHIELQAEAMQDGAAGEIIWLRFTDGSKRLRGRVQQAGLATLVN